MARFTLILKPNGKALLVTPDAIRGEQVEQLGRLWREWRDGHQDVLFLAGTDVKVVEDIEWDLEEEMAEQPKGMNEKSDMQRTAEQAQKDTERNQREQMSPNARDDAKKAGEQKGNK